MVAILFEVETLLVDVTGAVLFVPENLCPEEEEVLFLAGNPLEDNLLVVAIPLEVLVTPFPLEGSPVNNPFPLVYLM